MLLAPLLIILQLLLRVINSLFLFNKDPMGFDEGT